MAEKIYKKRIADQLLAGRLEEVGAVLAEGPKWCGKTTNNRANLALGTI